MALASLCVEEACADEFLSYLLKFAKHAWKASDDLVDFLEKFVVAVKPTLK